MIQQAPARKVSNHGNNKFVARFPSLRAHGMVVSEGHLELDFLYLLDDQEDVTSIIAQPYKVRYCYNQDRDEVYLGHEKRAGEGKGTKRRICYPDFRADYSARRTTIFEVKYSQELLKERVRIKLRAMRMFAESKGFNFEVMTEYDIRTPALAGAKERHFAAFRRALLAPQNHISRPA